MLSDGDFSFVLKKLTFGELRCAASSFETVF